MPKIKINEWKGIYTNADENNLNFSLVRDSINFLHKNTYVEFEPYNLQLESIPNPNDFVPGYNWTWETGIYANFINDPMWSPTDSTLPPINNNDNLKRALVLVAKAIDNDKIHRLVFLREEGSSTWRELSQYGDTSGLIKIINYSTEHGFDRSFFTTTIEGKAFFRLSNGIVKLYLPHDCFWIGRLYRTQHIAPNYSTFYRERNGWYIDRLIEPFDVNNQSIINTASGNEVIMYNNPRSGYSFTDSTGPSRRIVFKIDAEFITDQNAVVGRAPVSKYYHGMDNSNYIRSWSYDRHIQCFKYSFVGNMPIYPGSVPGGISNWPGLGGSPEYWYFPVFYYNNNFFYIPIFFIENIGISGSDWLTLSQQNPTQAGWSWSGMVCRDTNDNRFDIGWPAYFIHKDLFNSLNLITTESQKVSDIGLTNNYNTLYTVVTAVLDNREEVVVHYERIPFDFSSTSVPKFAVKFHSPTMPYNCNYRVTRFRLYAGFKGKEKANTRELEMVKDWNLLEKDNDIIKEVYLTENSYTGILFSENTGISFDLEKPESYRIITGFRDIITDSNISIGLATGDYGNLYHSTVGGGNLQPNLLYYDNVIPLEKPNINVAVGAINNRLFVISVDGMTVLEIVNQETGELQFIAKRTLEYGVNNRENVLQTTAGVVLYTPLGIYITNGFEHKLLSEPINNIVIKNYNTGKIYYNNYKQELYFRPTYSEDLYRFNFLYQTWDKLDKTVIYETLAQNMTEVET